MVYCTVSSIFCNDYDDYGADEVAYAVDDFDNDERIYRYSYGVADRRRSYPPSTGHCQNYDSILATTSRPNDSHACAYYGGVSARARGCSTV